MLGSSDLDDVAHDDGGPMMRARFVLAGLALSLLATAAIAPPAQADSPQRISRCGQTITNSSVYFDRDLNCTGGFDVPLLGTNETGSLPLTIDLRGHRLRGPGADEAFNSYVGDVFFLRVTIKNGRIDNWGTGFFAAMTSLTVTKVQFTNNDVGVYCGGGNCDIDKSLFKNNAIGTTMNGAGYRFTNNLFVGNGIAGRASGGSLALSDYTNNAFTGNDVGVTITSGDSSVRLSKNVFRGNRVGVRGGPYSEFAGRGSTSIQLEQNLFVANVDGVYIQQLDPDLDESASLKDNIAIRNLHYGFYVPGAIDLGGNKAAGNGKPCVGVSCGKY